MNTLDLEEAAAFLKCSDDTIRELVASGELPGAKVGRKWVFVDIDLIEWLRTQYAQGERKCQSIKSGKSGISTLPIVGRELENLLKPQTSEKRRKSTTGAKLSYGM
jgi:DNA binding domain, excisionase family